jgi:RNA polymerase sigma-70 factor, ECF subfamily
MLFGMFRDKRRIVVYISMTLLRGRNLVDYELIKAILAGDVNQFDDLMNRYYKELFRFIVRQTHDVETAKNLSQDIWMRIYAKLRLYQPQKATFRTWMYQVATNCMRNHFRTVKASREIVVHEIDLAAKDDILKETMKQEEVNYILLQMQKCLSERNYQMMMLHFFGALSNQELATHFRVDEKTIRNTLSLCIQTIKRKVGETHVK